MDRQWGMLIVVYLFVGGLSGGLLAVSALATLVGGERLARIARVGAWAAPWPVLAGTGLLVLDLGQPFYFWKLFVAFAPASPMWLGTWLLTLFSFVSLAYGLTFVPEWLWGNGHGAERGARRWQRHLAVAGVPLGAAVAIYTGVLLGVLVARPLWNTPILAQLFLVSALSTAAASLLLILRPAVADPARRLLAGGDAALIAIELVVLAWLFVEAQTSPAVGPGTSVLMHGLYGWTFWAGVVLCGLLVPLGLEILELANPRHRPRPVSIERLIAAAPILVVAGGFALRWVLVYAGQASHLL